MTNTNNTRLAALERYGGQTAGDRFGDPMLKFNGKTGTWTAGAQGVEVPAGTQLIADIPQALAGFQKWAGGELVGETLQPITETDLKALRASLSDTDENSWPKNERGQREDPWREAARLPMRNPKTGTRYLFATSSLGGTRAVRQLVGSFVWQLRAAPETTAGHLPLVELGADSYKHPDRKRGVIFNPVLTGIDWVPVAALADKTDDRQGGMPAPKVEPAKFEDHRSEKEKKRRKASL